MRDTITGTPKMTPIRMQTACLRTFNSLIVLLATLALTGCGGGSGAPNNQFAPLTLSPNNLVIVSGVTSALTVTGGTAPYTAVSNNPGVLPVTGQPITGNTIALTATTITASTNVTITATDAQGKTVSATVTVQPAPQPPSLAVAPATLVAYSGFPATLIISGGTPPYTAASSNQAILPVPHSVAGNTIVLMPANVLAETSITITVQDAANQAVDATVKVSPAPLLNSLTITPNSADCGKNAICSGQTGSAQVTVSGPAGGGIAGRPVRYDVVSGPFGILTPTGLAVTTLTTTSDATGNATVIIKADASAPTQYAQLRATDVTSGQQLTGTFLVQQFIDGTKILSIVPASATITGAYKGVCSTGMLVDYFIYGGTPPYRVTSSFPTAVTILNSPVTVSGGYFEAVTNGTCVDPLTFSIVDATGRQTTATLINKEGTNDAPTPVSAVAIAPSTVTRSGAGSCDNETFPFVLTGGTPPYSVASAGAAALPNPVTSSPGNVAVSGLLYASGVHTVLVGDSSKPQKTATATITCNP